MKHSIWLVAAAAVVEPAVMAQSSEASCDTVDPRWVCGQQTPEDVVALPGDDWVLASVYVGTGGMNLIDVRNRASMTVFPSAAVEVRLDARTYPNCPGPPEPSAFTTHGLYVEPAEGPLVRVMAVGHGARESIEVFEVDMRPATPKFTWIGCVIAPEPIGLNSVRGLDDGGFITTNWLPRGSPPEALRQMMRGERNGELWEWHTATGWQKVPGSEAAGANGVELSADGRTIYMAAWGSQSFIRLTRGSQALQRDEIPLGFRVDNIHFARDGSLLAAGQITAAGGSPISRIVKVDPETLDVRDVLTLPGDDVFAGSTTAIEVGEDLWLGSYRGDRIAIVPAP